MIQSFADKRTAAIFAGKEVRGMARDLQEAGRRKLKLIDAAVSTEELRFPPGNRLELPKGDRKSRWSIRINQQWRICFAWVRGDAAEVEIVDYH